MSSTSLGCSICIFLEFFWFALMWLGVGLNYLFFLVFLALGVIDFCFGVFCFAWRDLRVLVYDLGFFSFL